MPAGPHQLTRHGRLNARQIRFVNLWSDTGFDPGFKKKCAELAGYKGPQAADQLMRGKAMKGVLAESFERAGLTLEMAVERHKEALDAKKTNQLGEVQPDHAVRLRAVKMAYDGLDVLPRKRVEIDQRSVTANFNFDMDTLQRAEEASGESIIDADMVETDELNRPF